MTVSNLKLNYSIVKPQVEDPSMPNTRLSIFLQWQRPNHDKRLLSEIFAKGICNDFIPQTKYGLMVGKSRFLDLSFKQKNPQGVCETYQEQEGDFTNGTITMQTSWANMYSKQSLTSLLVSQGFVKISTFVISAKDGHLIYDRDPFNRQSRVGILVKKKGAP